MALFLPTRDTRESAIAAGYEHLMDACHAVNSQAEVVDACSFITPPGQGSSQERLQCTTRWVTSHSDPYLPVISINVLEKQPTLLLKHYMAFL